MSRVRSSSFWRVWLCSRRPEPSRSQLLGLSRHLAAIFIASFLMLDPDLARERMRPGGQSAPFGLKCFPPSSLPIGLSPVSTAAASIGPISFRVAAMAGLGAPRGGIRVMPLGDASEPFLLVRRPHPIRSRACLVTSGPYAFIRHPGYLAGLVVILASGLALGSWLAAALLVVT